MGMVPEHFRLPRERLKRGLTSFVEAQRLTGELVEFSAACVLNPEEVARSPFGVADADKAWDAIHYVLDSDRRAAKMGARTTGLGGRFIQGTMQVPEHLRNQDQRWIGYSMPPDVKSIADELRVCNFRDLVALANLDHPETMLYRRVNDDYVFHWYEELAKLYHAAANRDQAVLILDS